MKNIRLKLDVTIGLTAKAPRLIAAFLGLPDSDSLFFQRAFVVYKL
jgi:predicted lipid carrier protein YhbT